MGRPTPMRSLAFVAALASGADFAKGTRFSKGGSSHDITHIRRLGNAALNGLVNHLFGTRLHRPVLRLQRIPRLSAPGARPAPGAFPGGSADAMQWGDGFEIETLINVRMAHAGARITEVGSTEKARLHGVSNLHAVSDGLRVLRTVLAERRRARRMDRTAITDQVPVNGNLVEEPR